MKKLHRKKSKRVSLRQKHKIGKKEGELKKKLRKETRRMSAQGIKRVMKRDPGIPNLCPQKKELLQELQHQKTIEVDHKQEVRRLIKEKRQSEEFSQLREATAPHKQDNSLEALIAASDIILEVLDARDPCPCPLIPSLSQSKPHIFVLNKADQVPSDILGKWQEKISQIGTCFLFQTPVGEKTEMKETLKAFLTRNGQTTVGVIGYPNVGKSTLINTLKGYKIAPTSKLPGGTKKIDEYQVDELIKVLDSPPIEANEKSPVSVLRTTTGLELLQDPYTPVQGVLEKVSKEKLLMLYAIPEFKDIKEFLTHIAKKMGKVVKGGLPDFDSAAKIVLHDWFTMKIPYQAL